MVRKQQLDYRGIPDTDIGTIGYADDRFCLNGIIPVGQHKNFKLLILIMAFTSLIVAAVSITSLYNTAFDQHRLRLIETVKSQARLIEAIASFNAFENGSDTDLSWQDTTLQQIKNAHSQFKGFGETGEYALARLSSGMIEFVLSHRHFDLDTPKSIPYQGKWAEPMRLALGNKSGTIIALDYRGEPVLAAYEPVAVLNLGLVAKIDLSEIRTPFIQTGLISLSLGFIIVLISSQLFFRIAEPITQQIEQQAETFQTLAETASEGIVLINTDGLIQYINPAGEAMFGYTEDVLLGQSVNQLMPLTTRKSHDQYINNYLGSGIGKIIGIGRQLVGQRKNGSQFPMHLSIGDINLKHTRLFAGVIMDLSDRQKMQREIMEVPVREQRRIGQELHDGIGQQLTGLGMLARSLVNKASKPEYELASQLSTGLQEALAQVRALSRGLVPIEIDAAGFVQSLRNLTDEIRRQSHMPVTLKILNGIEFGNDDMVMHLYRIAQEALNNAIKHAEASNIQVTLDVDGEDGILEVYDNGRGMSDEIVKFEGLGLSIMKYRCSLFEGEVKVDPAESGGTRVCCRFPLKQAMETT